MRTAIVATFALSLTAAAALAQTSSGTSSSGGGPTSGSTTPGTTQGAVSTQTPGNTGTPSASGAATTGQSTSGSTEPIRPVPPNSQTSSGSGQTPGTRTGKNALNETFADCMKLWEPATHMSQADWQRTCRRVQGRLDQVSKQVLGK